MGLLDDIGSTPMERSRGCSAWHFCAVLGLVVCVSIFAVGSFGNQFNDPRLPVSSPRDAAVSSGAASEESKQLDALLGDLRSVKPRQAASEAAVRTAGAKLEYYKRKTYYKTASLLANSSRAVAALGGLGEAASQNAYTYGKHVGLAFQFVDDYLDFTASSALLGKPAGNDLRQGIATAPVLFAAEEHKELLPLIRRKFAQPGDAERALELVGRSEGLERTQQLAEDHAAVAVEALKRLPLPEGEGVGSVVRTEAALAREALVEITRRVLERKR